EATKQGSDLTVPMTDSQNSYILRPGTPVASSRRNSGGRSPGAANLRLTIRFQRFPRGLSGSRQMARECRCCTPNMPCGALGNRRHRVPDPAGKPLDERFNEGRGLTEISCGFAAYFFARSREATSLWIA